VVAGLFALGEPFGEQLGAAARSYVLGNFASCAMTEPFARWPQKVVGCDDGMRRGDGVLLSCWVLSN